MIRTINTPIFRKLLELVFEEVLFQEIKFLERVLNCPNSTELLV